jgi:hypothetical protein
MDNSVMDNTSDVNQTQAGSSPQITEKMIPQSHVNEIVGNAKREAAERAVEAYKRQESQSSAQHQQASQQHIPNPLAGISEDDIKKVAGSEIKKHLGQLQQDAQERANVEAANRIVGIFKDKIVAGKDRYDDFESVTGNVAMQYYPNVVHLLAEHVDNSADVLYHLARNRDKLYRLEALSSHNSADAVYEIKRLADSIRQNDQTSQTRQANSPLSQQRPSNTGTDSGTTLSMSDLKRKYRG